MPEPRLPASLKVGPLDYQISDDPTGMAETCRSERADLLGHCNHRELVIRIEPQQAAGQRRDTLLHEALHAVFEMNGLASEWGDDTEESVVRRLTTPLLGVLRDNPELVAYLTATDRCPK